MPDVIRASGACLGITVVLARLNSIKAAKVMTKNMLRKDTAEGITAFLEKRSPNWTQ